MCGFLHTVGHNRYVTATAVSKPGRLSIIVILLHLADVNS